MGQPPVPFKVHPPIGRIKSLLLAWCMGKTYVLVGVPTIFLQPMRFQFLLLALLVSLLVSSRLEAQTFDLRGVVVDSATGERIPFVSVSVPALKRGASTNADGFYLIGGLPLGHTEVVANAIGYERRAKSFNVQNVSQVTLNFQLSPKPVVVGEVVSEAPSRREEAEGLTSVHTMTPSQMAS